MINSIHDLPTVWLVYCSFVLRECSQRTDSESQDSDKQKTYDYARIEYSHLLSVMFVDSDELLICPEATGSISEQREFQQQYMNGVVAEGVTEDLRVLRRNYDMHPSIKQRYKVPNRTASDDTAYLIQCAREEFSRKDIGRLLSCWGARCVYETLPKSADMYSICPFHWTHDSCRLNVYSKFNNCACKEGVMHVYPARPGDCHLMHLNAQKYWKSRDDICVNLVQNMTWTSTNLAANLFLSK